VNIKVETVRVVNTLNKRNFFSSVENGCDESVYT